MESIKIILQVESNNLRKLLILILMLSCIIARAQVTNKGLLYVADNSYLYLSSNNYILEPESTTITSRTSDYYGKVIFGTNSDATSSPSNYVDGYLSSQKTAPLIMQLGQSGTSAPIKVEPVSTSGVDASFVKSVPLHNDYLNESVAQISNEGYWIIRGVNSKISLSWRTETLAGFNSTDLTIVGYNGSAWVAIESVIDTNSFLGGLSNLNSGSISSVAAVNLNTFSQFTIGTKGEAFCPIIAPSSGIVKTWNGSWSTSQPTETDNVIINSNYSSGSFTCNSLVLNANIVLHDGEYVNCVNGVTGTGKIIMSSNASFVQRNATAQAPTIELTKKTRSTMKRFDYVYWGTPISGNFINQLASAKASTASLNGAFDLFYKYTSGTGGGWNTLNEISTGSGFISRIKEQAPFVNASSTDFITLKFTGYANNGNINVNVVNDPTQPNGSKNYNLLANPYPCAIDADKFLSQNLLLDGALYIWTAATPNTGTAGTTYNQADYIVYTRLGTTYPSSIVNSFTGKIASGQGFKVKALDSGTATFTNCMRLNNENTSFFKTFENKSTSINQSEVNRFKINMVNADGIFSQILIGYTDETTLGYDRMYDATSNSTSTAQLFSLLDNTSTRLSINARPTFLQSDVVKLGIKKNNTNSEQFQISVTDKEGLFLDPNLKIFLHDNLTNVYHDLNSSQYNFYFNQTISTDRFEIVYQNPTLSDDNFNSITTTVHLENGNLIANSKIEMSSIEVFDLTGRKVKTIKNINDRFYSEPFEHESSVYLIKIYLDNGFSETKKIIQTKD